MSSSGKSQAVEFMRSILRRTSQFLSPGLSTLLFCHVRRWRPKMGHDHHELFKANLLNFSLAILMEVSEENSKSDALKCTDNNWYIKSTISSIIFHPKCKNCLWFWKIQVKWLKAMVNYCTFCQKTPLWSVRGWDWTLGRRFHWNDLSWGFKIDFQE